MLACVAQQLAKHGPTENTAFIVTSCTTSSPPRQSTGPPAAAQQRDISSRRTVRCAYRGVFMVCKAMLIYCWHALKLEGVHRAVTQPCIDQIHHNTLLTAAMLIYLLKGAVITMTLRRLSHFLYFICYMVLALSQRIEEQILFIEILYIFEFHDVLLSISQHIFITSRKVLCFWGSYRLLLRGRRVRQKKKLAELHGFSTQNTLIFTVTLLTISDPTIEGLNTYSHQFRNWRSSGYKTNNWSN
jgi:hypothetical protein